MKAERAEIIAKRERIAAMRRVLRLPHTVEQLALRFNVAPATVAKDLETFRAELSVDYFNDPPTYWRPMAKRTKASIALAAADGQ